MELLEGIETRRSFRAFKPTPVPKDIIEKILKASGNSPSYTNTQPWEVAVVSGKKRDELCKIIYDLANADTPGNPDTPLPTNWPPNLEERTRIHGKKRLKVLGVERDDKQGRKNLLLMNFELYGAPCALFLFMDSTLGPWSMFDMGSFSQSISLAAHSFGIGSCLQAMLAIYPDSVREFLGIPKTKKLVVGISIGYPDLEARLNDYHSLKVDPDTFTQWYT